MHSTSSPHLKVQVEIEGKGRQSFYHANDMFDNITPKKSLTYLVDDGSGSLGRFTFAHIPRRAGASHGQDGDSDDVKETGVLMWVCSLHGAIGFGPT